MINKILNLGKKIRIIPKSLDEEIEELMQDHLRRWGSEAYNPHWRHFSEASYEERLLDYKNKKLLIAYHSEGQGYVINTGSRIKRVPVPLWEVAGFVPEEKYKYKRNKEGQEMTEIQPIPKKYQEEIKEMIIQKYGFSEGYKVQEGWPFSITLVECSVENLKERINILEPSSTRLSYYHRNQE